MTRSVSVLVDLMKLLRPEPLTPVQIQKETGLAEATVSRWLAELTEQGLLTETEAPRIGRPGYPAKQYQVSANWRGGA